MDGAVETGKRAAAQVEEMLGHGHGAARAG
jgi:hypothetical protein